MCRIDLCGQICVKVKKWSPSHFMKMRSLKTALGQFSPTRGQCIFYVLLNDFQIFQPAKATTAEQQRFRFINRYCSSISIFHTFNMATMHTSRHKIKRRSISYYFFRIYYQTNYKNKNFKNIINLFIQNSYSFEIFFF